MGVLQREHGFAAVSVTLDPPLLSNGQQTDVAFNVPGLKVGDLVFINSAQPSASIFIVGCRVTAADTLTITFYNWTGGGSNPAAATYTLFVFRPEITLGSANF